MDFEIWLAFVAVSTALLLVPGPTVLLVLSYAVSQGRSVALATVGGVALGDFMAMNGVPGGVGRTGFGFGDAVYGAQVDWRSLSDLYGNQAFSECFVGDDWRVGQGRGAPHSLFGR